MDEQMEELIAALRQQTDAINRLANTNAALIEAMAEAEGLENEELEPSTYLDGEPIDAQADS